MITLKFKYKQREYSIQCQKTDKMKEICQQFATQNDLDFISKIFVYDDKKLNLKNNNYSIMKLLNLENNNNTVFDLIVFDDPDKEIITRTVIYKGEEHKIPTRKNENIINKLASIFTKKANKFILLSQGDLISEKVKFNQLPNTPILMDDNDERNSFNPINDDNNQLPLIPQLITNDDNNKNNNNNTNNNTNNINNNNEKIYPQNEKTYIPPNDKIYIPPNQNIELKEKNENKDDIEVKEEDKENNKEENKKEEEEEKEKEEVNKEEDKPRKSLNFSFEDDIDKLLKIFLILIIQFVIIFALVYFGFLLKINEKFIDGLGPILGTFIPVTIVILLIAIPTFILMDDDFSECWNYFQAILYFIIYIFAITFYCFLLSKFTEQRYILCTLSQILYQFIAIEIYLFIFKSTNSIGYAFSIIFINLISILLFYFFWIKERVPIVIISSISLGYIIYLIVYWHIWKTNYDYNNNILYVVVFGNYGLFMVVDGIIGLFFYLALYLPISACKDNCECCNDCCFNISYYCCDCCDCCDSF